jgi:hypothetical protein
VHVANTSYRILAHACIPCHLLKRIVHQHVCYSINTTVQHVQAIPLRYTPRQIAQLRPAESSIGANDDSDASTVRIVVVESDADEYNLEEREMLKALDNTSATTTAATK